MTELEKEFESLVSTKDEIDNGIEVYQVGEGIPVIYLEKNEMKVFEYIGKGHDNRVSLSNLANYTGIDSRTVSTLINLMRDKKVPIGSDRSKGGFFICDNEAERQLTLSQFEADIRTKIQTHNSLKNASLDNWSIAEAK